MKKSFIILATALAALVACNKNEGPVNQVVDPSEKVMLRVAASSPETRATVEGTANENKVSDLQVFVFRNGTLEVKGAASTNSVGVRCAKGTKTIVTLVNAPVVTETQASSLSALEDIVSEFTDNAADKFVMVGKSTYDVTGADNESTSVNVDRIAARVRIQKITNNLPGAITLERAYLTRVATNEDYGLDMAASSKVLANVKDGVIATSGLYYSAYAGSVSVASEGANTGEVVLYAYPNNNSEVASQTRLVLQIGYEGNHYTYPVIIANMRYNYTYDVTEMIIKSLGNSSDGDDENDNDEDEPISKDQLEVSVVVNPWTISLLGNGGVVEF